MGPEFKWVSEDNHPTSLKDVLGWGWRCWSTSCKFRFCPYSKIHSITTCLSTSCFEIVVESSLFHANKGNVHQHVSMIWIPMCEGFSWEEMANKQEKQKRIRHNSWSCWYQKKQNQTKPRKLINQMKPPRLRNQKKPRRKNKTWFQTKQTWQRCWHKLWRSWYNVHRRRWKLQKQIMVQKLRN